MRHSSHFADLTARLIPFYRGEQPDSEGRLIEAIWKWDFEALEIEHDYIQWLFPLPEASAFNADAPIVNPEIVQEFRGDRHLQANLRQSLRVMLNFYGLSYQQQGGEVAIAPSADFSNRREDWLTPYNHNYRRITRILKCLINFGLEREAQAFYQCLRQLDRADRDQIGGETFQYWHQALSQNR